MKHSPTDQRVSRERANLLTTILRRVCASAVVDAARSFNADRQFIAHAHSLGYYAPLYMSDIVLL